MLRPRVSGLQCGRGWLTAEGGLGSTSATKLCVASMWPRLVNRGRHPLPQTFPDLGRASMWPRLVNRGRVVASFYLFAYVELQCGRGWLTAEGAKAAGMCPDMEALQCGRGWLTAEGTWRVNGSTDHSQLQCRRGWLTAEGGLRSCVRRWMSELQCGRGWLTAEGPPAELVSRQWLRTTFASGVNARVPEDQATHKCRLLN